MDEYKLSKDIIKLAIENKEIETLRLWTILRTIQHGRSGLFTLDDLVDILLADFGYKSLKRTPKNATNIKKFKKQKYKKLRNSIFFTYSNGDLFRINSQKKLLINYKGNASTQVFTMPGFTISSSRAFMDAYIGIVLTNTRYANETSGKIINCTPRRIQQATARNHESGLFPKQHRKIIEPFATLEKAKAKQLEIINHGIFVNDPFPYKGGYAIAVSTSNQYTANVLRRFKGKLSKREYTQGTTPNKLKSAFRGRGTTENRYYYEEKLNGKCLEFDRRHYSLNAFILDHSKIL